MFRLVLVAYLFLGWQGHLALADERLLIGVVFEANNCLSFPEDASSEERCSTQMVGPYVASMDLLTAGELLFGNLEWGPQVFHGIEYHARIYVTKWPSLPLYGVDVQLFTRLADGETQMTMLTFYVKDISKMEDIKLYGNFITKDEHRYTSKLGLFAPLP